MRLVRLETRSKRPSVRDVGDVDDIRDRGDVRRGVM